MPKKVLIALPQAMLEQVDYVAAAEHRTRSDLIRESLRRYLDSFKRVNQPHLQVIPGVPQERVADLKRTGAIVIDGPPTKTTLLP